MVDTIWKSPEGKIVGFETVGYLVRIFQADDPRPAKEQVEERYNHGGGWNGESFSKIVLLDDGTLLSRATTTEPWDQDDILHPIAYSQLQCGDSIALYDLSFVCIKHLDGSYDVIRMD